MYKRQAVKRLAKKENAAALRQRLEEDAAALRQGVTPLGGDRYLAAVYPDAATACLLYTSRCV